MRFSAIAPVMLFGTLATAAHAMPMAGIPSHTDIHRVQMVCTPQSCIDQRTGVYTRSTCNAYGCRQLGGPVGRLPGYGRGRAYGYGPGYGRAPHYDGRGYGGPAYGGRGYRGGPPGGQRGPAYYPPTCSEC